MVWHTEWYFYQWYKCQHLGLVDDEPQQDGGKHEVSRLKEKNRVIPCKDAKKDVCHE